MVRPIPGEPWWGCRGGFSDHSMLLLIDPSCSGINDLIAGLDYACPAAVKLGGIASPHSAPHDSLLFDQGVWGGAVGCLIDGAWGLDPVVAQGCRPIGPVFEVEQAQRNVVLEVSAGNQRNSRPWRPCRRSSPTSPPRSGSW
jgi:small ligand-binding sensory domain FIST